MTSQENAAPLSDTLIASVISGMLARIPMHPIDTCKAKMQIDRGTTQYKSTLDALTKIFRAEGLRGLYSGFGTAFIGSGPAACLYFTSYEVAKRFHPVADTHPFLAHFTAGLTAECFSCVMWVPIDVIKERLQVQSSIPEHLRPALQYKGNLDAARTILAKEGLRGMYKGYGATVASFGPFSALYLSGHEEFKKMAQKAFKVQHPEDLPAPVHFASGVAAGGIAAFVTNPLDMAKLRIQVQRGNAAFAFNYRNVFHGVYQIAKQEGLRGLFKGAGARTLNMAPSSAISMFCFEAIRSQLQRARRWHERSQ